MGRFHLSGGSKQATLKVNYRTLGKPAVKVSALGFGAMRLPTLGSESEIDEPRAISLLRHGIDQGINYIDTAYVYHGGTGEGVVGRALADGYRQRVHLATKLPIWNVEKLDDCDRLLDEQLQRLQTDHIDFYLLHCLQARTWPKLRDLGVLGWLERARADGRIGQVGFSFHDTYELFTEIIDVFDWSFCQIQYNICNEDVQAGTRGLRYAASKGLGVIVMEPLFGGTIASPPPAVRQIWDSASPPRRPADVALRWLWNRPEVSLVLSGMTTAEQLCENVDSASRSGVGTLSEEDSRLVARVQEEYKRLSPVPCTKCGYCMPCPAGVNIPVNFELFNNGTVFQGSSLRLCKLLYNSTPETQRANACVQCGQCEEKCPQGIEIRTMLKRVCEALG